MNNNKRHRALRRLFAWLFDRKACEYQAELKDIGATVRADPACRAELDRDRAIAAEQPERLPIDELVREE